MESSKVGKEPSQSTHHQASTTTPTHVVDSDDTTKESTHVPEETGTNIEPNNQRNKRLKSDVWNHFEAIYVDDVRQFATCNYCQKQLKARSNDGTSHLRDHFKSCPRKVTRDIRQQILVHEQKGVGGSSFGSKSLFDADSSRQKLARMIIFHDYPLSMVEHCLFREFVDDLQPLFKVPSRPTVKSDVMKEYEKGRSQLLRSRESNDSRIALTSDMWTASNQQKSYMAVTAHYIDENWTLRNQIISFTHVSSPHTAEVLSQAMMECLLEWNIDNKLSTLTLDNCSTNDSLVDKLLGNLTPLSLILKGKIFHMRCCAHIINLIVQDGFSVISGAIKNVRDSVLYWDSSPKRTQEFKHSARQIGVDCKKELVHDVKTRWNSVYLMLTVALEYKDVFIRLSKKDKNYVSLPSEEEWVMASEVCEN